MTPQDYLAFEHFRVSRRMADALRTVVDLRDQRQLAIAFRHAGYGPAEIEEYGRDALEIEQDRRSMQQYIVPMEAANDYP